MINDALNRRIVIAAGISGALGVVLGSFGAHGLDAFLSSRGLETELIVKRLGQFDTGVRYHLLHSAALLALAGVPLGSLSLRRWIFRLFLFGLILFSGSLYVLVLTNTPVFGAITPIGGLCWIASWMLLPFLSAEKSRLPTSDDSEA